MSRQVLSYVGGGSQQNFPLKGAWLHIIKMTALNSEIHFVQLFYIIPVLNNMSSGLKIKTMGFLTQEIY